MPSTREQQWLQQLAGEWTYETDPTPTPDGGAPVVYRGTEHARTLGDAWLVVEQRQTEPADSPGTSLLTLGHDPARGRVVGTFVTSMMPSLWVYEGALDDAGRMLTLETEGPSFTTEGAMGRYRDVLVLEGDDRRVFTSSYLGDDGAWHTFMTMRSRRTA